MHKFDKIILINEITFIIVTITFFYLGADRIPPFGFIGLIICVLLFALAQYFYLKGFVKNLDNKTQNIFIKNFLGFVIFGISVALSAILINSMKINYIDYSIVIFNLILVALPIIFYGIYLYYFNIILLKIIK